MQNKPIPLSLQSRIWKAFKICLAFGLVVLVVSRTDVEQLASLRERISWPWLAASFVFLWVMALLKAWQYRTLIGGGLTFSRVFRIVIWQNLLSNFVATGAGLASYFAMFRIEEGVKLRHSGLAFLMVKAGDLLAIGLSLGLSAGMAWQRIPALHAIALLLAGGVLAAWLITLMAVTWSSSFGRAFNRLILRMKLDRIPLLARGGEMLAAMEGEQHRQLQAAFGAGTCLSLLYMTATMVFSIANMKIFIPSIEIWPVIFVTSLMQLISYIPILVLGGLGVTEATSVYFYSFFGFPQPELAAVMLGLRVLFLLLNATTLAYLPVAALLGKKEVVLEGRGDNRQ